MDSKELRGLVEAYSKVYAPIDEGKSSRPRYSGPERVGLGPVGSERRTEKRAAYAEYRKGHTEGPGTVTKNPKKLRKQKAMGELGGSGKAEVEEQLDIFDVVLEFLQAEGYAETLEQAEWMMANLIDEEAVAIILEAMDEDEEEMKKGKKSKKEEDDEDEDEDEEELDESERPIYGRGGGLKRTQTSLQVLGKHATARDKKKLHNIPKGGTTIGTGDAGKLMSGEYDRGKGSKAARRAAALTKSEPKKSFPNRLRRNDGQGIRDSYDYDYKEAFESWLDEAMSNYEKNRKRAAQRAAARNAARDQGKTGAVPGVGYVTPRRERETWTDESGKTRHAKGL